MPLLDPHSVLVPEDRQRKISLDFSDIQSSIERRGQIHPIVVRRGEDGTPILVVGWRRLMSCRALNRQVEVKWWDDLSADEAEEIELEENIARQDLHWRDYVRTIGKLHAKYIQKNPSWTIAQTGERLGFYDSSWTSRVLAVCRQLDSPLLKDASDIKHAYSILQRASERRAAAIVNDIISVGRDAFKGSSNVPPSENSAANSGTSGAALPGVFAATNGKGEGAPSTVPTSPPSNSRVGPSNTSTTSAPLPPPTIILTDFLSWAKEYDGPKFNLIHCDFPYGIKFGGNMGHEGDGEMYDSKEDIYFALLDALTSNLQRLASYQAHLVFWFSMTFYEETRRRLSGAGLLVQEHPLVWLKSDDKGIIPGRDIYPRRVYETAFLATLGRRPLSKMFSNAYAAPSASPALHPSQKPEPVLRYFFSGLVDGTTDVLDPTCGSGSALRAAEDLGARSVLGLESNPEYMAAALAATQRARTLRQMKV